MNNPNPSWSVKACSEGEYVVLQRWLQTCPRNIERVLNVSEASLCRAVNVPTPERASTLCFCLTNLGRQDRLHRGTRILSSALG